MAPHSWNRSTSHSQAFRRVAPIVLCLSLIVAALVAVDRTPIGTLPPAGELPLLTDATIQYPTPQATGPKRSAAKVEVDAAVQPQAQAKPVVAIAPTVLDVKAVGADGAPYGVGMLEMSLAQALELGWYHDQAIELKAADSSIWLPACRKLRLDQQASPDEPSAGEERLKIYFLYSKAFPANVDLAVAGKLKLTTSLERHNAGAPEHTALLQEWWSALCQQTYRDIPPALAAPTHDLFSTLGLRLGLAPERPTELGVQKTSSFEQQFERMLGMLLGFESVRLAMMIDDSQTFVGPDPAMYALPPALNIASNPLPSDGLYTTSIEPIAQMVPHDCFYVRCGSIQNYMWLRQFLMGWGGSLDEIVTQQSLDTDIRGRIESQLGINAQQSLASGIDQLVSDLAVVGTDVFFEEGAGIGILLQATAGHEHDLEAAVEQQRLEIATRLGALQYSQTVHGNRISLLHTPDYRMRSFLVRLGRYLLITNSQKLLESVLKLQSGSGSLAELSEFRYALATSSMAQNSGVTFYLSDPFFRRITSPAFRVELNRRREAARDCRRLAIASLLARSMGEKVTSRQSLIDARFLPNSFGIRPDGSRVELVDDQAVDSLRGRVGTFIPVIDIAPTTANQNELLAYQWFTERYQRQWRAMDPVLASVKSTPGPEGLEQVAIQIHITPYARSEYAFLTRSLAAPTQTIVSLTEHELVGVSAGLHSMGTTYQAHLGVCDDAVPFRIERGELLREGTYATSNFAQQRSFAAVTPPGTGGLHVLAEFMKSIQTREPAMIPQSQTPRTSVPVGNINSFDVANGILSPLGTVLKMSELVFQGAFKLSHLGGLYEDAEWSIYGSTPELRQVIRQRLVNRNLARPAQIYLYANGVDGSDIAAYLNAYSYCASRRQSSASAAWLNLWTVGLHAEPKSFTNSLEQALHGQLKCSLGGQWRLQQPPQWSPYWNSTMWAEPGLAAVNSVPAGYRFPFLEWLKGVQLNFNLDATSLNSEVLLYVAQGRDAQSQPIALEINARATTRVSSRPTISDSVKPPASAPPVFRGTLPARSTPLRKSAVQRQRAMRLSP